MVFAALPRVCYSPPVKDLFRMLTVTAGVAFTILIASSAILSVEAETPMILVTFTVGLPAGTPDGPVYIAGNLPEVGGWNAAGFRLDRVARDRAVGSLRLPADAVLEFKITRGSWATGEKDAAYHEIANRRLELAAVAAGNQGYTLPVDVAAWGDSAPPAIHTYAGDIRFHEEFHSRLLGNVRTLRVYLPPGYAQGRRRYPVLYMHDGQNVFDAATSFIGVEWGVDEACEKLIASGEIPPMIVVAIDNNESRVEEYTPTPGIHRETACGGRGPLYERFLISEVKPFIDRTYRTKPGRATTSVMGSSLGGLLSLDIVWKYPSVFSSAGVVSPSLWWNDSEIIQRVRTGRVPKPKPRLWIDMGTREGDSLDSYKDSMDQLHRLETALIARGFHRDRDFTTYEAEGGDHSERSWNARIEMILKWLYAPAAAPAAAPSARAPRAVRRTVASGRRAAH